MKRIFSIEAIRGLAMLGVIGIHTGAWSLSNPQVNMHLFALLEIVSRFSVPVFFFITAFGLFYPLGFERLHELKRFPSNRLRKILVPYIFWSLLYMSYYSLSYGDNSVWQLPKFFEYMLFGLGSYQLYFLVLMLVFLALTPLLAPLAGWIAKHPFYRLGYMLIAQIIFNAVSSYTEPVSNQYWLDALLKYRLNYLPLHYLWIYMLGAVFALGYQDWHNWLEQNHLIIKASFWGSLSMILAAYYWVVLGLGWSLEQAVSAIHQLSPIGVLYTGASALYLSMSFSPPMSKRVHQVLNILASHSFFIFLVHPFVMSWLQALFASWQLMPDPAVIVLFYLATLLISLGLSAVVQIISSLMPLLSLTLTGKAPAKMRGA